MFSRRDLLMGVPAVAGLGQQRSASPPQGGEMNGQDLHEIRDAVRSLQHLTPSSDIDQINERRRLHFKVNQRFPAYIDVGLSVWERLTTWHQENRLPLTIKRAADGRLEMDYMFTTLVLKWEIAEGIISAPYD